MNSPNKKPGSSVLHVRSRQARPGPETTLLDAVIKTEFLIGRPLPAVFFHEPDMPTGLPDLVAVYMSNGDVPMSRMHHASFPVSRGATAQSAGTVAW